MYKVIVVEDERKIRKGLINLLDWNHFGFDVVAEASNGQEGIEVISYIKPSLVITDIKMPKIDGIVMLEKTMHLNFESIVISGYGDYEFLRNALKLNVHDYLLKPISKDALIKILLEIKIKLDEKTKYETSNQEIFKQHINIPEDYHYEISLQAFKIIKTDYSKNINTKIVAKRLNISEPTLNKYLMIDFKLTFHHLLNYYRLEKAIYHLNNGNLLNYEIASEVGFSNYKYFSSVFKNTYGISCNEYREKIKF